MCKEVLPELGLGFCFTCKYFVLWIQIIRNKFNYTHKLLQFSITHMHLKISSVILGYMVPNKIIRIVITGKTVTIMLRIKNRLISR